MFESRPSQKTSLHISGADKDEYLNKRNIIRFLAEAISCVLKYNNMNWVPPVSIPELLPNTSPLFTQSIEKAITHYCMEKETLEYEPNGEINLEELLQLSGTEAETHIRSCIRGYMEVVPREDYYEHLYFICFVCQLCVHAIRNENKFISSYIFAEAVDAFYARCHYHIHFINIIEAAVQYNSYHKRIHDDSDDDGFSTSSEDED
ncbi:hypothetical protein NPIL_83371 [Nephila pilipes]|uniref:Uncharacterized protein n=1 Tax=Nephila pilipes TaxID=299642 RepID=A0A8X6NA02_NEPPI|nr:hypothetical protein NPIL_83371 [Nephila pilipes]